MIKRTGVTAACYWSLPGILLGVAFAGLPSIGRFVFPFALAVLIVVSRRNHPWPEAVVGLFAGGGAVLLAIAFSKRDFSPCPDVIRVNPQDYGSCGGSSPTPWLIAGLLSFLVAMAMYHTMRRASKRAAEQRPE